MIFLGIDGGGTRCRARLRDVSGRALGEGEGGPANIHQDFSGTARSILDAAHQALEVARLPQSREAELRAGFGLAGIVTAGTGHRLGSEGLPFAAITAINDAHAACLGAHGGADGGIVITGTGSAGYLIHHGKGIAVGGWGFEIGDDGSGAHLGRAAIRRAVLSIDGLAPTSPLTDAVLDDLGRDQPELARWAKSARPADYARFAPLVISAAEGGDSLAGELLTACAADVTTLADRLLALGAPRLCLLGGLALAMRERVGANVRAHLASPLTDAMDGAIMVARLAAGLPAWPATVVQTDG